jgi:8-oxo-dGTP pyrophosphatase MutT (NUDIX family)
MSGDEEIQDGVVIVLQRGEHFLVGRRAQHKPAAGYWTQVSGKVEAGERQHQTVVREAMEELGCRVEAVEKLQQLPSHNGKYRLHYWRARILEGEPRICNDEITALRWVTVEELRHMSPTFDEEIDLFERLLEGAD